MIAADRSDAVRAARKWAKFYRRAGYQPLPSAMDKKKPLVKFADHWECEAPDHFARIETTNIQVMTGRYWDLCVVDLDGPDAIQIFDRWTRCRGYTPRTWVTGTGGGGMHLWFSLPPGLPPMPKRLLWGRWDASARDGRGDWAKHEAIELLCDHSLVIAPPSIHPTTGRVYRFAAGRSPREIARPATIPGWLLGMPHLERPRPEPEPAPAPRPAVHVPSGRHADYRDVLDAIPDKVAVARSWGLRFPRSLNESDGWITCHDFNREDVNPSARFHREGGRFWRPGELSISLFELGAELRAYRDWRECCQSLAVEYGVIPSR